MISSRCNSHLSRLGQGHEEHEAKSQQHQLHLILCPVAFSLSSSPLIYFFQFFSPCSHSHCLHHRKIAGICCCCNSSATLGKSTNGKEKKNPKKSSIIFQLNMGWKAAVGLGLVVAVSLVVVLRHSLLGNLGLINELLSQPNTPPSADSQPLIYIVFLKQVSPYGMMPTSDVWGKTT